MKLSPLLLLVFILCMLQGNAQEFQKKYTNLGDEFQYNSFTTLSDTSIAVISINYTNPMGPQFLKLDKAGNVTANKKFSIVGMSAAQATLTYSPGIIEGSNKSLTIAYASASTQGDINGLKILQIDSNSNLMWSKRLPGGNTNQHSNLTKIGHKYYGITNICDDSVGADNLTYQKCGIVICGLNENGSTIFSNKYFGPFTEMRPGHYITKNRNGNLVVCAPLSLKQNSSSWPNLHGTILELDTFGNVLKSLNVTNTFLSSITQDEHGNYLLVGMLDAGNSMRYFVSLLSENFNPIWTKIYFEADAVDRIKAHTENDTIYVFSKHESNYYLNLIGTKLDYNGNGIESYNYSYRSSLTLSFDKSVNGNFLIGDLLFDSNQRHFLLRSSKSIDDMAICPTLHMCAPKLLDTQLQIVPVNIEVQSHIVVDVSMQESTCQTTVADYCVDGGILDASFTLAKDTFCSGEQFDLKSNLQLLSGESVWQITGPDNFMYMVKDTLGIKLDKAGSYTVLHLHKVAFCTDSFSRTITILGGASTVSITTCDTIRAAQISNCPFNWPDGSSDSIYIATNSGTWNISAQCAVCTSNVAVHINVTPKPYLLEKATDICEGKTLPYTLIGQYISDALWADGSTGTSYSFDSAGTYALMLYNNGCTQADTLSVNMIDCRTCDLYLPNAFTPNGDGNNDAFGAYTNCTQIIQFSLQVFNRWGEKVYETNDLDAAWDGTHKDQAAPEATYVYYVSISYNTATDAETRKYKGSVMLIR